jgi:Xaa-Pro aminopeptidase
MTYLEEFLARRRSIGEQTLHVRLSEPTEVDQGRGDAAIFLARRMAYPWGSQPSEDAWRVRMLRERYPYYRLVDVAPHLDALRMIKTESEIAALRRIGRISAEAHRRAIAITRPGIWEYEIEAEAAYVLLKEGAEGNGYPAIVGSGPNGLVWHYQASERQAQAGELIVMDYGGDLAYQTMDITRTWPVSGEFDELQEKAYRCVLEAQKAVIAAMRPGVTRARTREISRAVFEKWGFDPRYASGAGHFVGMSVHDVGDASLPLQAGMVIAVEPILEIPEANIHIRIEDTVLVTETGAEVLSAHVPKEVDELLALMHPAAGN